MANLPSGTVTFLFTDIEGSTKLAQGHPDKWEDLRGHHHAILQSAMNAHNGYVFQIIGDAFCVAFHTASDGLNAALDAQRNLQQEDWGETPIKVRMGLHTGSAQIRGAEYQGYLTLAKVQRVMSVAYGGQVLLSNASAELLHGELQNGISLRDMQEHRLKGLPDPEHLWQLVAPDLRQDFLPLQSLMETPNNLPVQLTSFIGREKEVGQIKQRLEKNRLVTLTGSGGIGKTRLSIQVASELLNEYPHGVWLVELAPIADPALVTQTVFAALNMTPQGNISPLNALTEYLKPKKTLLVVDNCEHLIDASAQLCEALLHACSNVRIIASSREALGIDGENAYRVPSLSLPNSNDGMQTIEKSEAVKLFMERATATLPEFEMTQANASFVAQICQRLDGVALAIELAASRVKLLKVEQIAARLNDAFRLLTGGNRTALPRQQTLRALIDWSYNLLSEEERTVLCALSIFMGGWTLESAEYVCDNPNMLDLLTHLLDKSLVAVDYENGDESRYYLLETIRQYAREKLSDSDEAELLRTRHSNWFLKLSEHAESKMLAGENYVIWFGQLENDRDNLRTALAWLYDSNQIEKCAWLASKLGIFWWNRNYFVEGRYWLETGLEHREILSKKTIAHSLRALSRLLGQMGDYDEGIKCSEESVALFRELGDKFELALALQFHGMVNDEIGDDAAYAYFGEALQLYRALGYKLHANEVLVHIGWGDVWRGNFAEGFAILEECVKSTRELGEPSAVAYSLHALGICRWYHDELEKSEASLKESLRLFNQLGNKWFMLGCLVVLAGIACKRGQLEKAARFMGVNNKGMESISGGTPPWFLVEVYNPILDLIRSQMEHSVYIKAWNEGYSLTKEQTLYFALEVANE